MLVFPTFLFAPESVRPRIIGASVSGGRSMGGVRQTGELSGGGLWQITFGEAALDEREAVMAWRAMESALDNGATPIIVPVGDRLHAPVTSPPPTLAFSDDSLWDDATSWTALEVNAVTTATAALRATTLLFTCTSPLPLIGGEYFSILHAGMGWRMYQIIRLTDLGGGAYSAQIRTPLRAEVASGTPLNFEAPRVVCALEGDPGGVLEFLRFGKGGPVTFTETFSSLSA